MIHKVHTCSKVSGKERFKTYIKAIGSGEHTSKGMSREESAEALHLMLTSQASPVQIGAFMMAHRIRRPEPQELAGMLDTYLKLGPNLFSTKNQRRPICFGMPFDGRNRTSPVYPLTALILLSEGQPVVLHGGQRMPMKYGVTTSELFESLGLNLTGLTLKDVQAGFNQHGLAFIHQPDHFSLAESLIGYRDEIGKRPPLASMELIWTAHQGNHLLISGFVHPPTEKRAWEALEVFGEKDLMTIKGLEGSTDLSINRKCITARVQNNVCTRLLLNPREYEFHGKDIDWNNLQTWSDLANAALENHGPLSQSLRWNAGVYLWLSEITDSIEEGLKKAEDAMDSGSAKAFLQELIRWRKNIAQKN